MLKNLFDIIISVLDVAIESEPSKTFEFRRQNVQKRLHVVQRKVGFETSENTISDGLIDGIRCNLILICEPAEQIIELQIELCELRGLLQCL